MKKLIFLFLSLLITKSLTSQNLTQTNFISITCPQYMASGTNTRLPVVFRASVIGLLPNTTYRYFNQAAVYSDLGTTNPGAGNPMLISSSGNYTYSTSPSLSTSGNYETFTTDASGRYTGWFAFVNTGNTRFTAGNYIIPSIVIDSAGNGIVKYRYALNDSIKVFAFGTSSNSNEGTGLYGISYAVPKNIIALYDNVGGTGRPISMTYAESEGITVASTVQFYTDSVNGFNGRYGTIIPNLNSNGVRRIEQFSVTTGLSLNFNTDPDGIWPSGANTVNPIGGSSSPVRITITDAPLSVSKIGTAVPQLYRLYQNYPNPFNPVTRIRFDVPSYSDVRITIYDITGREVVKLVNQSFSPGQYEVEFDARGMTSGVYFYMLSSENFSQVKKLTLIK